MTEPDDERGPRPELDLGKLLAAAQEWARRALPESAIGSGGPECQWCPICQFVNVVRGEHPEVAERIAEAGTALAGVFKALADAALARAQGEAAPRERPRPSPRVQRIDLDDPRKP